MDVVDPVEVELAQEAIDDFCRQFGAPGSRLYQAYRDFARHAALPLTFTADLLYRLQERFRQDMRGNALHTPWVAVADLMLSHLCHQVRPETFRLDKHVQDVLLAELQDDRARFWSEDGRSSRLEEVANFLIQYAAHQLNHPSHYVREAARAERLNAQTISQPDLVREQLQKTAVALQPQQDPVATLRLASLVSSFNRSVKLTRSETDQTRQDFNKLQAYTSGQAQLAEGKSVTAVAQQFRTTFGSDQYIEIAGEILPVPTQVLQARAIQGKKIYTYQVIVQDEGIHALKIDENEQILSDATGQLNPIELAYPVQTVRDAGTDIIALNQLLNNTFSLVEFEGLMSSLELDLETITSTPSKGGRIREAIQHLRRRQRLDELINLVSEARQDVDWDQIAQIELKTTRQPTTFATLLEEVESGQANEEQLRQFGQHLFTILFDDALQVDFFSFYETAVSNNAFLRLELEIGNNFNQDLALLPWELLCLPDDTGFGTDWLAAAPEIMLRRRPTPTDPPKPPHLLPTTEPLRIAVIVGPPAYYEYALADTLTWEAYETLARTYSNQFTLLPQVFDATRDDLADLLDQQRPHIVHIIAHTRQTDFNGQKQGEIALARENANGPSEEQVQYGFDPDPDWFSGNSLALAFTHHKPATILLQSGEFMQSAWQLGLRDVAASLAKADIPAVVSWQFAMDETAVAKFIHTVFPALVQGIPFDEAVQNGRRALLSDENPLAFAAPSLFANAIVRRTDEESTISSDFALLFNFLPALNAMPQTVPGFAELLPAVDAWLANPEAPQHGGIFPEQISGKSAAVANLIKYSQGLLQLPPETTAGLTAVQPGFIAANHLYQSTDPRTMNPRCFIQSIAAQLANKYPAYNAALRQTIENFANELAGQKAPAEFRLDDDEQGKDHPQLNVVNQMGVLEAFDRLIVQPWLNINQNEPILILIDGLDDMLAYEGATSIPALLGKAPLPAFLRFFLAANENREIVNIFTGLYIQNFHWEQFEGERPSGTRRPDSKFMQDATIPDDSLVQPGETFAKIWQLRNTGTRNWSEGFRLTFVEGESMTTTLSQPIPKIQPGEEARISISLTAPTQSGSHVSVWRLQDDQGIFFGDHVWAKIIVDETTVPLEPPASIYDNFDIHVGQPLPGPDMRYPITISSETSGELQDIEQTFSPVAELGHEQLARLRDLASNPEEAIEIGQRLFRVLMREPNYEMVRRSLDAARNQGKAGLRLRVQFDDPTLQSYPWELCHDGRSFIFNNPNQPILLQRTVGTGNVQTPPPLPRLMRLLVAIAAPVDQGRADVDIQEKVIRVATEEVVSSSELDLQIIRHATLGELDRVVASYQPNIVQFIGHGSREKDGMLILENEAGRSNLVPVPEITRILAAAPVQCVILSPIDVGENSTTQLAPQFIQQGIPTVLAEKFVLPDQPTIEFWRTFYRALLFDRLSFEEAIQTARHHLATTRGEPFWSYTTFWQGKSLSTSEPDKTASHETPFEGTPYKGLLAFLEEDEEIFFGREALTNELVTRVIEPTNFLAIIGAAGSGKTSLVRAGMIPQLRRQTNWLIHLITPTNSPLSMLANSLTRNNESLIKEAIDSIKLREDLQKESRALSLYTARLLQNSTAERLLLVVDQFEELFTQCKDEAERDAFVGNLVNAAAENNQVTILLTLRAYFYSHCAQYDTLRTLLATRQRFIGAMNSDELRAAIELPAQQARLTFEEGLVDILLRDVGATDNQTPEPGVLPLLSHALLETWQRRDPTDNRMTLRGYMETGGVRGAVAMAAESTYQRLPPDQQIIARNIFLQLTELGEGTQDTRRRVALDELLAQDDERMIVEQVIAILTGARLLVTSSDGVEVVHEALIREWPRLRSWLDEAREELHLNRKLAEDARDWDSHGREESYLYRGSRLAQITEIQEQIQPYLDDLSRQFLEASIKKEKRDDQWWNPFRRR